MKPMTNFPDTVVYTPWYGHGPNLYIKTPPTNLHDHDYVVVKLRNGEEHDQPRLARSYDWSISPASEGKHQTDIVAYKKS